MKRRFLVSQQLEHFKHLKLKVKEKEVKTPKSDEIQPTISKIPILSGTNFITLGKDKIEIKIQSYHRHKCSKGFFSKKKQEMIKINDTIT